MCVTSRLTAVRALDQADDVRHAWQATIAFMDGEVVAFGVPKRANKSASEGSWSGEESRSGAGGLIVS